ncbi:MAG: efflux RND transporter periplasmic adaptor subunit [Verrucomicrobiota bacterium]
MSVPTEPTPSERPAAGNPSRQSQSPESMWVTLDLVALLNETEDYEQAAMALCNELSFHFRCTRVSLGNLNSDGIKLQATSHSNKIEKRMEAVQELEKVMLEAADQDEEILWPEPPNSYRITREHEQYSQKFGALNLLSIPLRLNGEVKSVLTLQRDDQPFSLPEADALRLMTDLITPRLTLLYRVGRGWWRRGETTSREWLGQFLGAEHTWWKLGAVLGCLLLLFLCFFPWPNRISGDFTLKTDALINMPAPFEGFIEEVYVIPGDEVTKDAELLALDTRELKLQEKETRANMQRFRSEAQVAMGQSSVGDMHVATAKATQMEAELKQILYKLNRARILSPFDGVVVEGSLREQIGAPVNQGDVLMKVTRLEDLYVLGMVSEKNIQDVELKAEGAVAFASRPEIKFPIVVELIEPAAVPMDKDNVFHVRCRLTGAPADWWRPGMSGVIKIDAGTKPPIYLMTSELIDFLRMKLWL